MIRPTRLIRRTALVVANLTPDSILGLTAKAVCWLRHDAYFAGAEAAIRGDELPFNVTEINGPAAAFAAYDHDVSLPDPCPRCGHKWHGLACTSCSCASAWKESA